MVSLHSWENACGKSSESVQCAITGPCLRRRHSLQHSALYRFGRFAMHVTAMFQDNHQNAFTAVHCHLPILNHKFYVSQSSAETTFKWDGKLFRRFVANNLLYKLTPTFSSTSPSGCTTTQPQHTWPSVIFCRRSYSLEFASGRAPRSRLYRKHFQTVAEDISFCAALVWTAR